MTTIPKLSGPSLLLLLLLLVIYVAATATTASLAAPSPAADDNTTPAPSPDDMDFLHGCVEKFTDKCGIQVYHGVFRRTKITKPCCKNLVQVGKRCHDGLVRRIYEAEARIRKDAVSRILARSEKVWNHCVRLGMAPGRFLPARRQWLP